MHLPDSAVLRFPTASAPQVRGSIPLLWTQLPNMKYKPPTRIASRELYAPAFDKHVRAMTEQYKVCTQASAWGLGVWGPQSSLVVGLGTL